MMCVVCKSGELQPGFTSQHFERAGRYILINEIPCEICSNCGEEFYAASVTRSLLDAAERALAKTDEEVSLAHFQAA
jgi:YgiT-type zinc finger domain-containing protein